MRQQPKRIEPVWIAGIHETYEGIRSFTCFKDYLEKWIRPNLLEDLDTIFEGAKLMWRHKLRKDKQRCDGRGDFYMALPLLAAFDHFGGFLTESADHWIAPAENIARVARHLDSTFDITAVLSYLGRNALAHGSWPQTSVPIDSPTSDPTVTERWAFGLSFNANKFPERHDTFHVKPPPDLESNPAPAEVDRKVLKLVLNVHNLRQELLNVIDQGVLFRNVSQDQFDRVKRGALLMGDPRKTCDVDDIYRRGWRSQDWRYRRPKTIDRGMFEDQIGRLLAEAKRLDIWSTTIPGKDKVKRDHGGRQPFWRNSQ